MDNRVMMVLKVPFYAEGGQKYSLFHCISRMSISNFCHEFIINTFLFTLWVQIIGIKKITEK